MARIAIKYLLIFRTESGGGLQEHSLRIKVIHLPPMKHQPDRVLWNVPPLQIAISQKYLQKLVRSNLPRILYEHHPENS